ncbi:MAG: hypothetical protein IJB69_05850 [Clostridia bacterium]|nr:hypothetical protein [Clostridia bacterium]
MNKNKTRCLRDGGFFHAGLLIKIIGGLSIKQESLVLSAPVHIPANEGAEKSADAQVQAATDDESHIAPKAQQKRNENEQKEQNGPYR